MKRKNDIQDFYIPIGSSKQLYAGKLQATVTDTETRIFLSRNIRNNCIKNISNMMRVMNNQIYKNMAGDNSDK